MQKNLYFIVVSLVCALVLGLSPVFAQTYDYGGQNGRWGRASDFQDKINALSSEANKAVTMPILFGVGIKNISPNFGDPRSGGRSHEGEDIMATKGTPIISPTAAVVLRTGFGDSAGNYVYTANPGGETFVYMHLDRIGEGVVPGLVLTQGGLIGYVGNTGNASSGASHLHFEIHNADGSPTDPFPRLTAELSLADKMSYLTAILNQTTDSKVLAQFLVTNFRSTFNSAMNANLILPLAINNLLVPEGTTAETPARGDLKAGSSGASVVALQKYLIQANSGPASQKLRSAGATGTFGPVTKAALVEFQLVKGILPANGYYGSVTGAYITNHPFEVIVANTPITSIDSPVKFVGFTRDLYKGITSPDVRALQIFLNSKGFMVAGAGVGSPGKETNYFGLATEVAVKKFQVAHGIKPINGRVGPLTRATLNNLSD